MAYSANLINTSEDDKQKAEHKIAAAYIRVSTDDQMEYSPDAQLFELRKYADYHGYIIPEEYIFIDEGITGRNTKKRDEFQRMIGTAKIKPKPFDAILLWKFSRFARNRTDAVVYKSMLRKDLGINVISISEPIGDDKMSILLEAIIEAMDEFYSINLSEEVKRGMTEKARRGELQSTPSFGYTVENNLLIPHPEEAKLVREIFERFINGEGYLSIAKWLNSIGAKTHRGNLFENRTIDYIIHNPVYIGKLRWNPTGRSRRDYDNENIIISDANHEPLISDSTWNKAQDRALELKKRYPPKSKLPNELADWISGIFRCSNCGGPLVRTIKGYVRCNNYAHGKCLTSQMTKSDILRAALIKRLENDLNNKTIEINVIKRQRKKTNNPSLKLQKLLADIDKKISKLNEGFLNDLYSSDEFKKMKDNLLQEKLSCQEKIKEAEKPVQDDDEAYIESMKKALKNTIRIITSDEASIKEKHESLSSIIDSCVYSKTDNRIKLVYRMNEMG
ncbi:MAG: recombinase family protein [Clostridiales bacterium]|nr:recombinase family protein [Clostridiales bacterium]